MLFPRSYYLAIRNYKTASKNAANTIIRRYNNVKRSSSNLIIGSSSSNYYGRYRSLFGSNTNNASRYFSTNVVDEDERESMAFDLLIVGGGPAGLSASIRFKQLCQQHNKDLSVCLIDKGSEIGSHILSGNVFDPIAIHELLPDKKAGESESSWINELYDLTGSYATSVTQDEFHILYNDKNSIKIPNILLPSQLHNDGNYIISLSQLCRYLGNVAEETYGVEIYSGFAAAEVLMNEQENSVTGIATRDVGIGKDGITKKSTYERGVALHAKQTLFAEGARGSCSEYIIDKFNLRQGKHEQSYGIGLKEVWQIPKEQHIPGLVQHTIGFPLQSSIFDKTYGGTFLYHQEPDLVLLGIVVGLDYSNPYINPYQELQKYKTHNNVKKQLQNGTCISYGARVLNEGGYHSIPKLTFPGGALIGCSAGFLNPVKIKGTHTAIKSGIVAAENAFNLLTEDENEQSVAETMELDTNTYKFKEMIGYTKSIENSWVYKELYQVRNAHGAFAKWGIAGGLIHTGFTAHITKGKEPYTLHVAGIDSEKTGNVKDYQPIEYPQPDNVLTFDLLTNLQRAGTYHTEDQPSHLRIKSNLQHIPITTSMQIYGAPEQRFCPAGVYEYVDNKDDSEGPDKKLVINSQNCIHCKCCAIKTPHQYIDWTVPEGGGGPQYQIM